MVLFHLVKSNTTRKTTTYHRKYEVIKSNSLIQQLFLAPVRIDGILRKAWLYIFHDKYPQTKNFPTVFSGWISILNPGPKIQNMIPQEMKASALWILIS